MRLNRNGNGNHSFPKFKITSSHFTFLPVFSSVIQNTDELNAENRLRPVCWLTKMAADEFDVNLCFFCWLWGNLISSAHRVKAGSALLKGHTHTLFTNWHKHVCFANMGGNWTTWIISNIWVEPRNYRLCGAVHPLYHVLHLHFIRNMQKPCHLLLQSLHVCELSRSDSVWLITEVDLNRRDCWHSHRAPSIPIYIICTERHRHSYPVMK